MKDITGEWCRYCYNSVSRSVLSDKRPDLEAIEKRLKWVSDNDITNSVCLHGGEPTSWGDLTEELLSMIYRYFGRCTIQTNGLTIDEEWIDMFKKYKVSVGVSIDGYDSLNRFRCDEGHTDEIVQNIHKMVESGIPTSMISVISKANGLRPQRKEYKKFVRDMYNLGVKGRMNIASHPSDKIQLTSEELIDFYLDMADFIMNNGMEGFSPFSDIINSLMGRKEVVCIYNNCNPLATTGGMTVNHLGRLVRCHKFNTDYLGYVKNYKRNPREEVLSKTDCNGCKYFDFCHGGCPAHAVESDWRNKTEFCPVWKSLWKYFEKRLNVMRIPLNSQRQKCRSKCKNNEHEDQSHGDRSHGDSPHGDAHGDHYDA